MVLHTIKLHLWRRTGKGWDIVSRGAIVEIYGDKCNYIGPAPDGTTYFWLAENDYRYLTTEQLAEAGYILAEAYPKD